MLSRIEERARRQPRRGYGPTTSQRALLTIGSGSRGAPCRGARTPRNARRNIMPRRRLEFFLPLRPLGVAAMAVWVAIHSAAIHGSS